MTKQSKSNTDPLPRSACQGKAGFASLSLALSIAKRMAVRGRLKKQHSNKLEPYLCEHCNLYHLGNHKGWRK